MNLRGMGRNCSHFNVKDMITPVYIYVAHPDSFFLFSIVDVTTVTIVAIEIIVIIVTTVTSINMLPVSFVSGCI